MNCRRFPRACKYYVNNYNYNNYNVFLFRLATPKTNFVQKVLKVGNANHRKKIYLRATDLVLFGPPEGKERVH